MENEAMTIMYPAKSDITVLVDSNAPGHVAIRFKGAYWARYIDGEMEDQGVVVSDLLIIVSKDDARSLAARLTSVTRERDSQDPEYLRRLFSEVAESHERARRERESQSVTGQAGSDAKPRRGGVDVFGRFKEPPENQR